MLQKDAVEIAVHQVEDTRDLPDLDPVVSQEGPFFGAIGGAPTPARAASPRSPRKLLYTLQDVTGGREDGPEVDCGAVYDSRLKNPVGYVETHHWGFKNEKSSPNV